MAVVASTNLQLLTQLRDSGFSSEDLEKTHDAFKLAAQTTATKVRANWKPFLNHLVGVASIVAWDVRRIDPVIAAMLHSLLSFGRFPALIRSREKKLALVRDRLGSDVTKLIEIYSVKKQLREYLTGALPTDQAQRDVTIIKIADVLDDLLDERGPIGSGKKVGAGVDFELMADRAAELGCPILSSEMRRAAATEGQAPLIKTRGNGSFDVARRRLASLRY